MRKLQKWTSVFLLAPAGSGKTTLVFDLHKRNHWNILIVSPLKSLEREIQEKIETDDLKHQNFIKVMTAEKVPAFLERISLEEIENLLVVIDEVHLWNHWGSSFRPRLWECFYSFSQWGIPFLALTATLTEEYKKDWQELLEWGSYDSLFLDLGNGKAKFLPSKIHNFSKLSQRQYERRIFHEISRGSRSLLFFRYRSEVFKMQKKLKAHNILCKTCVGGESLEFMESCQGGNWPQVILSTSVLSHGVNLGEIKKVFISYEIEDWDIYLQMVARGGRKGSGFILFNRQKDGFTVWELIKNWLFDRYLRLFYA